MGNYPGQQEIQRQINSLQAVKQNSTYSILKAPDET